MQNAEIPVRQRTSREETARLGGEIYERDIRPLVEATHRGKIVAIDVNTRDYVIGGSVVAAAGDLRARRPEARVWSVRIGYGALRHFGGRPLRKAQ